MRAVLQRFVPSLTGLAIAPLAAVVVACGGGGSRADEDAVREDGPEHVHGLGTNPRDGALMAATHSGLFRLGAGDQTLRRVGDLRQDTMGFTVVGPDRFLGSGHPDARTGDPPHLGLIASDDGGRSWRARSLSGDADLHVLAAHPQVLYAVDALSGRLLASGDRGASWTPRRAPGAVLALVVHPEIETQLTASTDAAVFTSTDAGATWRRSRRTAPGLLTWNGRSELLHIAGDGALSVSADAGRSWRRRGALQAEPAAITATDDRVHVADTEGRIFESRNGGRSWRLRARP